MTTESFLHTEHDWHPRPTLSGDRYTSLETWRAEREKIWFDDWVCVGRSEEIGRDNGPRAMAETTVRVENQSWLDITVYVVDNGSRTRLGLVNATMSPSPRFFTSVPPVASITPRSSPKCVWRI